ncbi:hypothetical protein JZ751_024405 [Albula glossodonta]|uniref:RNA methyltransferase n=1 Tax=Albula glossodonta TaxID=121402 RepID=A0A8T2NRN8_9TELE|nr:hypothetical protein JZ751_024405 [Albula glossodonta]
MFVNAPSIHASLYSTCGCFRRKMIEMSLDKETVLPQDGRVDSSTVVECSGNPTEATCVATVTTGSLTGGPSCAGEKASALFTGSVALAERPAHVAELASSGSQTESVGQGARAGGDPARPGNGPLSSPPPQQERRPQPQQLQQKQQPHLAQKPQPQQPGQLRLNKRRNTAAPGFKHPGPGGKRRRRANSESDPVLPTNFLLGGNIFDPLNLNSLLDEEVNRAINAATPESSPLPAKSRDPVEILVPRDITDPLNLNSDCGILVSPLRSGGRRRHRNRHHGGGSGGGAAAVTQPNPPEPRGIRSDDGQVPPSLPGVVPEAPKEGTLSPGPTLPPGSELKVDASPVPNQGPATQTISGPAPAAPPVSRHRKRKRNSSRSDPYLMAPPTCGSRRLAQQAKKFQYGNYNKYYGYRNPGRSEDPRIRVLRSEWFRGKAVLDLGCNTGHLTLSIARDWQPACIVGLDIDARLVHIARQNIRHYLSDLQAQEARRGLGGPGEQGVWEEKEVLGEEHKDREVKEGQGPETSTEGGKKVTEKAEKDQGQGESTEAETEERGWSQEEGLAVKVEESCAEGGGTDPSAPPAVPPGESVPFPVSLRISRGPIAAPPLPDTTPLTPGDFPANVSFVRPEYDVIMCLSVTKWVHLNWGDEGLQRFFHRVYRHLRPGGIFILEPQPWASYAKRKKLNDTIYKNYYSIRFKPEQFCSYLTSEDFKDQSTSFTKDRPL